MNTSGETDGRKTWMIYAGVVFGIVGVLIVSSAAVAWYFETGLLILIIGIFFLMLGIRSGLKHRNPVLADILLVIVLLVQLATIVWFFNVLRAAG